MSHEEQEKDKADLSLESEWGTVRHHTHGHILSPVR